MNLAVRNAGRLLTDAGTLLASGSFATAASLAALSIEESGKVALLRTIALAKNQKEIKDAWKEYRSHKSKNFAWLLPDLVRSGASTLDELYPLVDPNSSHPTVLDQIKQSGFYTDLLPGNTWSYLSQMISEELARSLVDRAKSLLSKRLHTAREVELWMEHVGPTWRGSMTDMKASVERWHSAMVQEGLTVESVPTMRDFLFGPSKREG
jgi:AbiV family abortive infection protein